MNQQRYHFKAFSTWSTHSSVFPASLTFWAWEPGRAACWALPMSLSPCASGMSVCSTPLRWFYRSPFDRSAHRCERAEASGKRGAQCSLLTPPVGLSRVTERGNTLKKITCSRFECMWALMWPSYYRPVMWCHPPTIDGGFMQGVGVDFVIIIGYKHPSVCMPVVPEHSCDGGWEVG